MDWILDHLQIVIVIAAVIAAALQKLKRSRAQQAEEGPPATDSEEAERTRRIQEEIRRRIMERRGLAPAAPPPGAAEEAPAFPQAPPMIEEVRPVVVAPPVLVPIEAALAPDHSSEAEHQRQLLERFRELASAAERTHAQAVPTATRGTLVAAPVATSMSGLHAALRDRAGLRQAVVLREIVDPPLGLRPPEAPGQGIWTRL